jgi:hypothetical protein
MLIPRTLSLLILTAASVLAAPQSFAQAASAPIEELLVVGEQPGPSMWKVTKGGNTLWVIATHTPVPENMKWRARGIKETVASAQEVLSPPSAGVSMKQMGTLRTLALLPMIPMAMEGRKNPDGVRLKELIPPETYARWLVLRDKYIVENNTEDESKDIERWRPVFAAQELYNEAIKKNGMTQTSPVWKLVSSEAAKSKVKVTPVEFEFPIEDPFGAIRDLNKSRLDDVDCFSKTIDRIDAELSVMRKRANAWARGDIDALRSLPWQDQREACSNAIRNAAFVRKLGAKDIALQIEKTWVEQAEKSLAANAVTVAVLPLSDVLSQTTYLAKLKAKGYAVVEPSEQ